MSTRGRSTDLSNRHLLHIQSEREDSAEHMRRLEEAVHDVVVPAARNKVEVGLKPTSSRRDQTWKTNWSN